MEAPESNVLVSIRVDVTSSGLCLGHVMGESCVLRGREGFVLVAGSLS